MKKKLVFDDYHAEEIKNVYHKVSLQITPPLPDTPLVFLKKNDKIFCRKTKRKFLYRKTKRKFLYRKHKRKFLDSKTERKF